LPRKAVSTVHREVFQLNILSCGENKKGGGKMIPTTMRKYICNEIGAPRVITSGEQLEDYVSALLELDRESHLTAAEENLAELLILLIEAYVEKTRFRNYASPVDTFRELFSTKDLSGKN
jgi:hypothetical protein